MSFVGLAGLDDGSTDMHPSRPAGSPATPLSRRRLVLAGAALALGACDRKDTAGAGKNAEALTRKTAMGEDAPASAVDAPDLRAEAVLLPGLINSRDDGPFIDLVRAIGDAYGAGRLTIEAGPANRVYDSIARGVADLGFPTINASPTVDPGLPFRYSTTPFGQVSFVIYSHRDRRISSPDLKALARGANQLRIEGPPVEWGFPVQPFSNFESALRKVDAGRIDAFLWAQEEADLVLRRLGLKTIHRELHGRFGDVFLLPRGPRGEFVDRVLTDAINKLRVGGRLEALYRRIHLPWDPWQPYA